MKAAPVNVVVYPYHSPAIVCINRIAATLALSAFIPFRFQVVKRGYGAFSFTPTRVGLKPEAASRSSFCPGVHEQINKIKKKCFKQLLKKPVMVNRHLSETPCINVQHEDVAHPTKLDYTTLPGRTLNSYFSITSPTVRPSLAIHSRCRS